MIEQTYTPASIRADLRDYLDTVLVGVDVWPATVAIRGAVRLLAGKKLLPETLDIKGAAFIARGIAQMGRLLWIKVPSSERTAAQEELRNALREWGKERRR